MIAVALVGLAAGLIFNYLLVPTLKTAACFAGIALAYALVGHFVRPQADTSNLGWAGIFDNPFRYSDDINRFLLFLSILLWPGRFVIESLIDVFALSLRAHRKR
jgi:hypothetical protein